MMTRRWTTVESDGWGLVSAELRHAEYPATFEIPPKEDRISLRRGDGVKLWFDIGTREEGVVVDRVFLDRSASERYPGRAAGLDLRAALLDVWSSEDPFGEHCLPRTVADLCWLPLAGDHHRAICLDPSNPLALRRTGLAWSHLFRAQLQPRRWMSGVSHDPHRAHSPCVVARRRHGGFHPDSRRMGPWWCREGHAVRSGGRVEGLGTASQPRMAA